ncbi:GNAT family N-acetyltransferase [Mucilaginibacter flavus]|uniref:GNAT family N-acetyltransferase n=1 Tax=Mucilaginibacter flavus TaxID=931504 RepID=UPI0025B3EBE6|nr:GNAT family N-acetyltransferase [Mucilaginibacter flavus]MDN3582437.1 GNAT family N-acetyltransferase [Mucilaginibacter flavus]
MSNIKEKGLYQISRLSASNLSDVSKLHTAVYNKAPAPGFFDRKYNTAYTLVEHTGFIAYNQELQPIAFYGVIPCFMLIDGKEVLCAQSADTMTHPDYRNKGLFVELANRTFELCVQMGIKFLFGFPNQNSLPGFINKLGWQMAGQMDCFVIPVKAIPIAKLAAKFPVLKKWYSGYVDIMLRKYQLHQAGIPGSVLMEGFDGLSRNNGYLQNKTYSRTHVINVDGGVVWTKINNTLLIGDLSVSPANFTLVMSDLIKLAKKLGLQQIQFHTSRGTQLHSLFKLHYKAVDSFPVIFKDLGDDISTDRIRFTFADIDIF